jgi:KipI family sensor histidine kinase inhibitor
VTVAAVGWFGDRAVLVRVEGAPGGGHLLAHLREALTGLDVRPGMESVLVVADEPDPSLLDRVTTAVAGARADGPRTPAATRTVEIPVAYDGLDLEVAADLLHCAVDALVAAHARQEWSVAMMGFAPGFGYLVPVGPPTLPWELVPRRDRPRAHIPAGSVALAAGMSAVYPARMPGGWQLIGTSPARLFDATDERAPTLLCPGDRVRFVATGP